MITFFVLFYKVLYFISFIVISHYILIGGERVYLLENTYIISSFEIKL